MLIPHICLVVRLRMRGAKPPSPHMPSLRVLNQAQGQLYRSLPLPLARTLEGTSVYVCHQFEHYNTLQFAHKLGRISVFLVNLRTNND